MNRRIIVSALIKCKNKYLFIKQDKKGELIKIAYI